MHLDAPDGAVAAGDASPDATGSDAAALDGAAPDADTADAPLPDATLPDATHADAAPAPDATTGGLDLPSLGNNGGRVEASTGTGTGDIHEMQKQIDVQATGTLDGFEVGPAFLTRAYDQSSYIYIFVRVKNLGATRHCFVRAQNITFRTSTGGIVGSASEAYAYGTVGYTLGGPTGTCVAGGETAYLFDIEEMSYDPISSMAFTFDPGSGNIREPDTAVIPQDLAVAGTAITMNARDLGPGVAAIESLGSTWMSFDDQARPVAFSFIDPCNPNASRNLDAGEALPMCDRTYQDGHGDILQARIEFGQGVAKATSKERRAELAARARLKAAFIASRTH